MDEGSHVSGATTVPEGGLAVREGELPRQFEKTRWSLVATVRDGEGTAAHRALSELCRIYWYPLYAYARSLGNSPEDSEDITQGFFEHLLSHQYFKRAEQSRGKLRSFLLTGIKRYTFQRHEKRNAQKRGGGIPHVSIDGGKGEERYCAEPRDERTPEHEFDRRWALTLLESVMLSLQDDYNSKGKGAYFDELRPYLSPRSDEGTYAEVAAHLGISENGVKTAVHRMRKRYRELLILHVSDTVSHPEHVQDELRSLFAALE